MGAYIYNIPKDACPLCHGTGEEVYRKCIRYGDTSVGVEYQHSKCYYCKGTGKRHALPKGE